MAFDELNKYKKNDHFFFTNEEKTLGEVCNAPQKEAGVFLIYRLARGSVDLVYIGYSGKALGVEISEETVGGLFSEIVFGNQFGKKRKTALPIEMEQKGIEAVDIYWYDTEGEEPSMVAALLMQIFRSIHGRAPEWNGKKR